MVRRLASRFLFAAIALSLISTSAFAVTYTWNGGSAAWNVGTSWTPNRAGAAASDVLVFNGGGATTATGVPTETIGQLVVTNNTNVTLQSAGAVTVTLNGDGGPAADLQVDAGSQLNFTGTANAITLSIAAGSTGSVSGAMTLSGTAAVAHRLLAGSASGLTFQNGSTLTQGTNFNGNIFGTTSLNSVVFASGSTYVFAAGANPFGAAQPNSVVVFQTGSLYKQQSSNTPSFSGRTYANFEMVSGSVAPNGGNAVSIDNLTVTGGTLTWAMTATPGHSIKGNISVAAGGTLVFNPGAAGTVNLNGPGPQTITNAGTLTLNSANQTININNANGITLGSNVTFQQGTLTLTSGNITTGANTLIINSGAGITRTSGHVIGNLRKDFAANGSKVFEVGTANGYSPFTANVTAGTPGNITCAAVQGTQPNMTAATSIARYWILGASAGITADLTFQYLAGDVNGNEAAYQVFRVTAGTPTALGGSINTGTHTATIAGISTFSDWTVGEAGGPVTPQLNVGDVTLAEGDPPGTTTFNFQVTLTAPAPAGGVSFNWATADNTATLADNDYVQVTSTPETITSGNNSKTLSVTVNRDTTVEPNETFFVNISGVTNATAGDTQGLGTINNDDVALTPIHNIQGNGASSPLVSTSVTTRGIVTGVKSNGFFIQEPDATVDADPATSEGVFVFTSSTPPAAAAVGNYVQVAGTVAEFIPSADPLQPPLTELSGSPTVTQLTTGNPLPAAIPLTATFPDPAGPFDQLERVEGMRVSVASLTVAGPTLGSKSEANATSTSTGVFFGVVTGVARPAREPGIQANDPAPSGSGVTIPPVPRWDLNPETIRVDSDGLTGAPAVDVSSGTAVTGLIGPLDYTFRRYTILPDPGASIGIAGGTTPTSATAPAAAEFTVAAYNMERFYDDVDDPGGDVQLTTTAYNNRLNKASLGIRNNLGMPDVLGVVEMEHLSTLQALATKINNDAVAAAQPNPNYVAYLTEGNDIGGIDVGFLVKTSFVYGSTPRVTVNAVVQELAGTLFVNADSSTELLNDRPPLRLDAVINHPNGSSYPVTVIVVHQRSLNNVNDESAGSNGWSTTGARVRAKRQKQSEDLANLIQTRQTNNPNEHIVVLGDFNAYEFNDGLVDVMNVVRGTPPPDNETAVPGDGVDLVNPDFTNLFSTPPAGQRYSYVFDGQTQNIDHVLVNSALISSTTARRIEHPRINADFPEVSRGNPSSAVRLSDHDPVVTYLSPASFDATDFGIDIQHSGYAPAAGQTTVTIVVTNNGPATGDASFSFPLPSDMAYVSDTEPSGWSCTTPGLNATGTINCSTTTPMAPGNATFTFTLGVGDLPANTPLSLSATVDAVSTDNNSANDTDNQTVTVLQASQYAATKTVSGTFIAGSNVTYTIQISNTKPFDQADNAGNELFDDIPSTLSVVSANATSGTAAVTGGGDVTWNGSISSGGSVTITIVATISPSASGTIDNQANLNDDFDNTGTNERASLSDDPGQGGTADATSFTVVPSDGAWTATKTVTGGSFVPGSQVTWQVVLTNNTGVAQPDNSGHEFVDTMPPGMTLDFASSDVGILGNPSLNVLTWDGALANGQSVNITIKATIDPSATIGSTISNQANIAFDGDGNGTNEQTDVTDDPTTQAANDPATFTVVSPAGLWTSTKSVSGTFVPGSNVTYTVTLTNHTGFTQNNNTIGANPNEFTDVLPASLTLVSANATSGTAVANTGTNTVTWNGSIADQASVTITIVATISPSASGMISNQGTAAYDSEGNNRNDQTQPTDDPSTGAANDATTFIVASSAGLFPATKQISGQNSFVPGSQVTWTVVLTNNTGLAQADNPGHEFVDTMPPGMTLDFASASPGILGNPSLNVLTWDGALANGQSANITIKATIDPSAVIGSTIANQANVSYDADGNGTNDQSTVTDDPTTAAANDSTKFTVLSPAGLFLATKTVSGTFVQGTNVTYTVTLTNHTGYTQNDVTIGANTNEFIDVLPASLTLVSANAATGTALANTGTNTVTWNGTIANNASVTITIVATINPSATGTVSNQGTANWDSEGNNRNDQSQPTDDPSTGTANDPTVFTISALGTYTATKSVSGTFVAGTNVTYTVVLTNNTGLAMANNAGNEFDDVLPASLTLVSANATSGTAVATVATNTVTWNGSLANGASVTVTIVATINPSATGTVSNQGTAHIDQDNNGSNETNRVTDNPSTGAANDATTFTVVSANAYTAKKTASGALTPGSTVTYTVVLTNGFAHTLANNPGNEFTDVLPAGLTLVSANATSGTAVATVATNTVTWNGSLAPAASVTITITATITAPGGSISNQGTAAVDNDNNGTNETNVPTDDPGTAAANDPTTFSIVGGDSDGDGVPDTTEQAAPNGGDANGDGIQDFVQSTVASIPAANGNGYLSLQSSCSLTNVAVVAESSLPNDPAFNYPVELISFRAACSSATFSLFVYGSGAASAYRKYGPNPPGGPNQWYTLPGATFNNVNVGGNPARRIDFSLTDGGVGDDTPVDGVIVDQGGPGGPQGAAGAPTLSVWMMLVMIAMLGWVALRRM